MQLIISKLKAKSILYVKFIDTLTTYCYVKLKLPYPISSLKRINRGLPRNVTTHDQSQTNVISQLDKSHQDLFPSITKPIPKPVPTNLVRITDHL
jgi:hypothetical protein